MMMVAQVALCVGVNAQNIGIGSSSFTPVSTLDVQGTVGMTITGSGTGTTTLAPTTSTVLYNSTSSATALTLPSASSFTNRIYIITNASSTTWTITSYFNLSHTAVTLVPIQTGIMLISDGTNWLQIR